MNTPFPYIVISKTDPKELLGGFWTFSFEKAHQRASALGGIVTNADWYRRRFGIDPIRQLNLIDTLPRPGPAAGKSRAASRRPIFTSTCRAPSP
jgi:hypothetical protein